MGRGQRDTSTAAARLRDHTVRDVLRARSGDGPGWLEGTDPVEAGVYERALRVTAEHAGEVDCWLRSDQPRCTLRTSRVFRMPTLRTAKLQCRVELHAVHVCVRCDSDGICDGAAPHEWLVVVSCSYLGEDDYLPADENPRTR